LSNKSLVIKERIAMTSGQTDHSKNAAKVYNKTAKIYFEKFHETCEYIDNFISLLPPKGSVLDVGCGTGPNSHYLHERGFLVEGIDLSIGMLKIAKKNYPHIKFTKMDMRSLRFKDRQFDGILVPYSLFHVPNKDMKKTLAGFRRVLKDEGVIYFALQEGFGEKIMTDTVNPKYSLYVRFFKMKEFVDLLDKNGFTVVFKKIRKLCGKYEFQCNKIFIIAKKRTRKK
jgi:ubiquinone/menaquinone biosynthesis C-methylase UbiE